MNVLASLLALGLLIVIHEAGHFLAARLQGIRVNGFSVGFGPAVLKTELNGITYALRLLPLGGFVSFPDDDDNDQSIPLDDPDLLRNRPIPQRVLVISAGVLANLLLAWLVLVGHTAATGVPGDPAPGVVVMTVQDGAPADRAGLKPGDRILSIDSQPLGSGDPAVRAAVDPIRRSPGQTLELEVQHAEAVQMLRLTPDDQNGTGRIGAQLQVAMVGATRPVRSPLEALSAGSSQFAGLFSRTVAGYAGLLTDFGSTAQQVSGPVKIVEMGAQLSSQGGSGLALFLALISINLGVLNALPLPLLDGGQLVFLLIEGVRGRPLPERFQLAVMQSSLLLVLGLSVLLIVRDTSQLSVVRQLMGQ
ncbi:RIP metalloprotease RseP [Synechococcus sp. A10-1-5-9]|uniref:RIP metalloprotease RseP n=1 Tax=Synechococcus sp. A10-1-5-9 TaxID=3392295 RepID=UPI0039ED77D2